MDWNTSNQFKSLNYGTGEKKHLPLEDTLQNQLILKTAKKGKSSINPVLTIQTVPQIDQAVEKGMLLYVEILQLMN